MINTSHDYWNLSKSYISLRSHNSWSGKLYNVSFNLLSFLFIIKFWSSPYENMKSSMHKVVSLNFVCISFALWKKNTVHKLCVYLAIRIKVMLPILKFISYKYISYVLVSFVFIKKISIKIFVYITYEHNI